MIHLVMHSRTLGIMNDILYRSLPHSINHHLFPHVIHDAHETCQQFGFLSSSKFLLGLLLAALLYPRGCHPPSVSAAHARDLPGRARGCTFQARWGCVHQSTEAGRVAGCTTPPAEARGHRGPCSRARPDHPLSRSL